MQVRRKRKPQDRRGLPEQQVRQVLRVQGLQVQPELRVLERPVSSVLNALKEPQVQELLPRALL